MYSNLLAEMARHGLEKKDIANALDVSLSTVENKIKGKTAFTVPEAMEVMKVIPGNLSFDYLFRPTRDSA